MIVEAIGKAGYEPGKQAFIALDPAASEFYNAEKKRYSVDGKEIDAAALVDIYAKWVEKYPDLLDRRRLRRGRLGRLETDHRAARRQDPIGGRRRVRHQHRSGCSAASTRAWPTASSSRSTRSAR